MPPPLARIRDGKCTPQLQINFQSHFRSAEFRSPTFLTQLHRSFSDLAHHTATPGHPTFCSLRITPDVQRPQAPLSDQVRRAPPRARNTTRQRHRIESATQITRINVPPKAQKSAKPVVSDTVSQSVAACIADRFGIERTRVSNYKSSKVHAQRLLLLLALREEGSKESRDPCQAKLVVSLAISERLTRARQSWSFQRA